MEEKKIICVVFSPNLFLLSVFPFFFIFWCEREDFEDVHISLYLHALLSFQMLE